MMIGQPGVGLLVQSLTCNCFFFFFPTSVLSAGPSSRAAAPPFRVAGGKSIQHTGRHAGSLLTV